jgi:hypothetical protein
MWLKIISFEIKENNDIEERAGGFPPALCHSVTSGEGKEV